MASVPAQIEAFLFDMDGVLTETAKVHAAAWKQMFDAYLTERGQREGTEYAPFDAHDDYNTYVDGKPRYDGVKSFLGARGIELPQGTPEDEPGEETIDGLGNRKNLLVMELIRRDGVDAYPGSIRLLEAVRVAGKKIAVVSSSANCAEIVAAAKLEGLLDVRVDGKTLASEKLAGKPAPDTYLHAAQELDTPASNAAVFEDALSGVEAGRAGDFGLVVGVNRVGQAAALSEHGADIVVDDLAELLPYP